MFRTLEISKSPILKIVSNDFSEQSSVRSTIISLDSHVYITKMDLDLYTSGHGYLRVKRNFPFMKQCFVSSDIVVIIVIAYPTRQQPWSNKNIGYF